MAKRGPKKQQRQLKIVAGTLEPGRDTEPAYPDIDQAIVLPAAFSELRKQRPEVAKRVLEIWNRKLNVYQLRGQAVAGFEAGLYQFCLLENAINDIVNAGGKPDMAMINGHRVYCCEFYDTTASNVSGGKTQAANKFGNNGKPRRP